MYTHIYIYICSHHSSYTPFPLSFWALSWVSCPRRILPLWQDRSCWMCVRRRHTASLICVIKKKKVPISSDPLTLLYGFGTLLCMTGWLLACLSVPEPGMSPANSSSKCLGRCPAFAVFSIVSVSSCGRRYMSGVSWYACLLSWRNASSLCPPLTSMYLQFVHIILTICILYIILSWETVSFSPCSLFSTRYDHVHSGLLAGHQVMLDLKHRLRVWLPVPGSYWDIVDVHL